MDIMQQNTILSTKQGVFVDKILYQNKRARITK